MFGLAERSRLAYYELTLKQAQADDAGSLFHGLRLLSSVMLLVESVQHLSGRSDAARFRGTLARILESIPSKHLNALDSILTVAARRLSRSASRHETVHQMTELLNALIFIRIVEVRRPGLASRAHSLRDSILAFLEPLYAEKLQAMERKIEERGAQADDAMIPEKRVSGPENLSADLQYAGSGNLDGDVSLAAARFVPAKSVDCTPCAYGISHDSDQSNKIKDALIKAFDQCGLQTKPLLNSLRPRRKGDVADENTQFCTHAAIILTLDVMERASANPSSYADKDAFIGALFACTFADYLTQKIGGDLRLAGAVAATFAYRGSTDQDTEQAFLLRVFSVYDSGKFQDVVSALMENLGWLVVKPELSRMQYFTDLFEFSREQAA